MYDDTTGSAGSNHNTQSVQQAHSDNNYMISSQTVAVGNMQNRDDASDAQQLVSSNENNLSSTMASWEACDVDVGAHGISITSTSHGFEEVVEVKPLMIMSCWSEAPMQEIVGSDFGSGQGRTASSW